MRIEKNRDAQPPVLRPPGQRDVMADDPSPPALRHQTPDHGTGPKSADAGLDAHL